MIASLQAASLQLDYARQLGGNGADTVVGMAMDRQGYLYIAGNTTSHDFPATGMQRRPGGSNLFRIDDGGA
jgi:hypothetical protein